MITAKVIQDSIYKGKRITSFELEYPRIVHAEFLTHRLFSRNSASSRAIPIETMIKTIEDNPAMPIHWGKNQPGMKAKEELSSIRKKAAKKVWLLAAKTAIKLSRAMNRLGVHKQIANRLTEPYQHMKVVLTATELSNWFWLRDHVDAQPEIAELARQMQIALDNSTPMEIFEDEWHLPYITRTRNASGKLEYFTDDGVAIGLVDAKAISASCCAQVSYRKLDDSLEKAHKIFTQLIESEPCHASPVEHQATPIVKHKRETFEDKQIPIPRSHINEVQRYDNYTMKKILNSPYSPNTWEEGITHVNKNHELCSGNFVGWIQHRQLIKNNTRW